jgi:hypothetical protein
MTGSLARLVLRAQGRLAVAEPLLPSRYAAGPQPGFSEEVGIQPAVQPTSSPREPSMPMAPMAPLAAPRAAPPAPRPSVGAGPETIAETGDPPLSAESRTTIPVAVPRPMLAEHPAAEHLPAEPLPPLSAPTVQESARATSVVSPHYRDTPFAGATPAVAIEPESYNPDRRPSPGVSPFLAREAALAAARSARIETPRPGTPASAPDVHISIGRLEVHATPARPAPVRAAPARQSGLSLADYLARRR